MDKCNKCGFMGEFISDNYGENILYICPECQSFLVESCKHEENKIVKYMVNGGFRLRNLCSSCLTLHGQFVKQLGLDLNKIKTIDKVKYDQWLNDQFDKYNKRYNYLTQIAQERQKKEWFNKHNEYLNSMEWQEKRDEVLKRDGYLCQACLKRRASQVHHISYKHWKNEPFYELVSVCDICHEAITEMDRNNLQ